MKIDDYCKLLREQYPIRFEDDLYVTVTRINDTQFQVDASTFPRTYTQRQQLKMWLNSKNIREFVIYAEPKTATFDVLHIGATPCGPKEWNKDIGYVKGYDWDGKTLPEINSEEDMDAFLATQKEIKE